MSQSAKSGFCIFGPLLSSGLEPMVSDGEGRYIIFATELEAQREVADNAILRLQSFLAGEREFQDAIEIDEYVMPVTIDDAGLIVDERGRKFSPQAD